MNVLFKYGGFDIHEITTNLDGDDLMVSRDVTVVNVDSKILLNSNGTPYCMVQYKNQEGNVKAGTASIEVLNRAGFENVGYQFDLNDEGKIGYIPESHAKVISYTDNRGNQRFRMADDCKADFQVNNQTVQVEIAEGNNGGGIIQMSLASAGINESFSDVLAEYRAAQGQGVGAQAA